MRFPKFGFVAFVVLGLSLGACVTDSNPTLISNHNVAVQVPASLTKCDVAPLPKKFNSNKDVASSYVKLYNSNVHCKQNMDSVRTFEGGVNDTLGQ